MPRKLGFRDGQRVALLRAPPGFERLLGDLPAGLRVTKRLAGHAPFDVILLFVRRRRDLERALPGMRRRMTPAAGFWVAWPKKSSGAITDITENVVRAVALPTGLVDNKVCAIDDTWSGLRLVIPLEARR